MSRTMAAAISIKPSGLAFKQVTPRLIHRPSPQTTDEDVNTLGHYIHFSTSSNNSKSCTKNFDHPKNFNHPSSTDAVGSLDDGYFSELFFSSGHFSPNTTTPTPGSPSSTDDNFFRRGENDVSNPIFFIGSHESSFEDSTLTSNCSLYDDLENSLNATVERNLDIHLSAASSDEFLLPEIALSGDEDLLQFKLELTQNSEAHLQTKERPLQTQTITAHTNPNSPVLQVSQSCPGLFMQIPSVSSPSLSPVNQNPRSLSDDGFGIPADSPLFFIPESNNEEFSSELTSEVGQESVFLMDGYSADLSSQSASPSTSTISETLSASPINLSPCLSPLRFIRICPGLTTQCPAMMSSEDDSSSSPASSSGSSKCMPRYLQIVRDPTKKKNQNREASQRYRNKKKTEVASLEQTATELRLRKKELVDRIEIKRKEANWLKGLLFEMDL